jgi:hypothetical protein
MAAHFWRRPFQAPSEASASSLDVFRRLLRNLPAYNEPAAAAPAWRPAAALRELSPPSPLAAAPSPPLAWAGRDALTAAAALIRERAAAEAAAEAAAASRVQRLLALCAAAVASLEDDDEAGGGVSGEEAEEQLAKAEGGLTRAAGCLGLSQDAAGDLLPLAAAARVQLTALLEDCCARVDGVRKRWLTHAQAAAQAAAEADAAAAAAAAAGDGSAGELTRALTAAEAAAVAAAWAHPEGSEAVVCSLPAGAGGSSVDILGKHMAR